MARRVLGILTLLLVAITPAFAQSTTAGAISGQVVDSSGAALPGVTVELTGEAMQGTRTTTTDSQGNYRFLNVPPGEAYRVTATLSGFAPQATDVQRVYLGQEATINFSLRAAVAEAITVTAEAPLVDVTRTTTGVNVTARQFESLPTQRTFQQLTTLAPSVSMEMADSRAQTPNSPNVGASSAPENNYIIDGLSTTDARYGVSGTNLTMNFVEEVQVMTGGYSAEFGRSTGGVFNVITKSGGNEFHGDVFGYYSDSSWSDARPRILEKGVTHFANLNDQADVGLSLGGPIMRDRLWFFAAFNPSRKTTEIGGFRDADGIVNQDATDFDTETDHYAAKLTFAATPSHNLVLTAFGDPTTQEGWLGPSNSSAASALRTRDIGSNNAALRYTGVFGPSFLAEATIGRHSKDSTLAPLTEAGRNVPRQEDWTPHGGTYGGFPRFQEDEASRDSYAIKFSNFLASHELRYGYDVEKNQYDADLHETWFRFYGDRTLDGVTYDYIQERAYAVQGAGETENSALFLQDQWKLRSNLQLNLGVRYETQEMTSARGVYVAATGDETFSPRHKDSFTLDNNWAPRLGIVWDPLNNGRSKVYASAGRFYEAIPLDLNIRALNGEDYILTTWYYQDGSLNSDNWFNPTGSPINSNFRVISRNELTAATATALDEDLKAQYQDEWMIGGEYQFTTYWSAGARYVNRSIGRVIEDFGIYGNPDDIKELTGYAIGNPGEGIGEFLDEAQRTYQAVELTLQRAFANNWQLYASFVSSRARGNYEGLYLSGYEQLDPNILALYDVPSFLVNADGRLRADRPYQFKVHSSYRFPFGLTVSEGFSYSAGSPISKLGPEIYNHYGDGTLFLTERGSEGRTPGYWNLDLHGDYDLPLFQGTGRALSLIVDVFNVFDNDETLEVDQDWVYEAMADLGGDYTKWFDESNLDEYANPRFNASYPGSPYWGTPILVQAPRTVQFGVKFTY